MAWAHRHLLGIAHLSSDDIVHVLDRLMQDVVSQSRLNSQAAIFAALAIVLQIISFLFTSQACWGP